MSEIDELRAKVGEVYGLEPAQAVERLIGIYKHAKSLQDALNAVGKDAKEVLSEIMVETGQTTWNTDSGRCYVTRPSVTVRYDAKALDRLAASDPKIAELLSPHRTESQRAGVLYIR